MKLWDYLAKVIAQFEAAELFYGHGTDNASDEAIYLVCASLEIDFTDTHQLQTRVLIPGELKLLDTRVRQRIEERIPTAYLAGVAWFAGYPFYSDSRALIPRSPIAELIGNQFEPLLPATPTSILDLCCGGGCIGIAAALEFEQAQVALADVDADCLMLAGKNVELHGLAERVTTVRSDLFANITRRYDLILCNPPYVSASEYADLPLEYRHEPQAGLVSDDDGLALPLRILREAGKFLSTTGRLIMEVGYSHSALTQRLSDVPLLWLEFEQGGEGVFCISANELQQYRARFI